jgi:1,4-dihydroxy-2-naphthoate octaprenyltransferase
MLKDKVRHWIFLTRPWSYPASAIPALLAISYIFLNQDNFNNINWINGLMALLGAVMFQGSSNAINDYFDYKNKVDTKESHGINRLLTDEVVRPREVLIFGITLLTAGALLGIYLMFNSGWGVLWIGAAGVVSAFFYYKLKYIALGDLLIFIIYGPLIGLGTAYVMTGETLWVVSLITVPVAFLIVNILHANNTRDIVGDSKAGIKTMAILLGESGAKVQYVSLAIAAYLSVLIFIITGLLSPVSFIVLLTLPLAFRNIRQVWGANIVEKPDSINDLDAKSAMLVMAFGILLSAADFMGVLI